MKRSDTNRALQLQNFNIYMYVLDLKISDLGSRGIVLCRKKGADQLVLLAYGTKNSREPAHFTIIYRGFFHGKKLNETIFFFSLI